MELKMMDFDLGDFFSPKMEKIALLVTLLIVTIPLFSTQACGGSGNITYCYDRFGFPMGAYATFKGADLIVGTELNELNKGLVLGFAVNVAFWYIVACIGFYAYGRFTGKGKLGEV